ncbi:hypothetical protein F511_41246 [Dorcoceras hygrometricum]|uniref:Uncharacterized protein n=1 Tax=Dorcoceras hygrometricum TaxID=472368 RepID=A0A2Z7CC40_9LAMI|nr:hypothetical protein F511_41246 [Dorcoceras hygrometricum]
MQMLCMRNRATAEGYNHNREPKNSGIDQQLTTDSAKIVATGPSNTDPPPAKPTQATAQGPKHRKTTAGSYELNQRYPTPSNSAESSKKHKTGSEHLPQQVRTVMLTDYTREMSSHTSPASRKLPKSISKQSVSARGVQRYHSDFNRSCLPSALEEDKFPPPKFLILPLHPGSGVRIRRCANSGIRALARICQHTLFCLNCINSRFSKKIIIFPPHAAAPPPHAAAHKPRRGSRDTHVHPVRMVRRALRACRALHLRTARWALRLPADNRARTMRTAVCTPPPHLRELVSQVDAPPCAHVAHRGAQSVQHACCTCSGCVRTTPAPPANAGLAGGRPPCVQGRAQRAALVLHAFGRRRTTRATVSWQRCGVCF